MDQAKKRMIQKNSISLRKKLSKHHRLPDQTANLQRKQKKLFIQKLAVHGLSLNEKQQLSHTISNHRAQRVGLGFDQVKSRSNPRKAFKLGQNRLVKTQGLVDVSHEFSYRQDSRSIQIGHGVKSKNINLAKKKISKKKNLMDRIRLEKLRAERARYNKTRKKSPIVGQKAISEQFSREPMRKQRNDSNQNLPKKPKRDHSEYNLRGIERTKKNHTKPLKNLEITFKKCDWRLKRSSQKELQPQGYQSLGGQSNQTRKTSFCPSERGAILSNQISKPNFTQKRLNYSNRNVQVSTQSERNDSQSTNKSGSKSIYYSRANHNSKPKRERMRHTNSNPNRHYIQKKNYTTLGSKKTRRSRLAKSNREVVGRNLGGVKIQSGSNQQIGSKIPVKTLQGKVVPLIGDNMNSIRGNQNRNKKKSKSKSRSRASQTPSSQSPFPHFKKINSGGVTINQPLIKMSGQKKIKKKDYNDFLSVKEPKTKAKNPYQLNQSEVYFTSRDGSENFNLSSSSHFKIGSDFGFNPAPIQRNSCIKFGVKILKVFFREKSIPTKIHFFNKFKRIAKERSKERKDSGDGLSPNDIQKCVSQIIDSFSKNQCENYII